jgi:GNAT superfamily N-acetyltransferase
LDLDILRSRLRHLGVARTLHAYLGRALLRIGGVTIYTVVCLEPERSGSPGAGPPGAEVVLLPPERLRAAAQDPDVELPPDRLAAELDTGDACYGALVDGQLAAYTFIAEGPAVVQGDVVVSFDAGWALSRWTYTLPRFRGRGLHAAIHARALADERGQGRRGLLAMVASFNWESRHALARAGFRPVATMVVARWGGRDVTWCSAGCRPYGLALAGGDRALAEQRVG